MRTGSKPEAEKSGTWKTESQRGTGEDMNKKTEPAGRGTGTEEISDWMTARNETEKPEAYEA